MNRPQFDAASNCIKLGTIHHRYRYRYRAHRGTLRPAVEHRTGARNRVQRAVERTVPFGFLVQTLVIVWCATHGYHRDDLTVRHAAEPWYPGKTDTVFGDMLAKARCTLIAARCSVTTPDRLDPNIIRDYELACPAVA